MNTTKKPLSTITYDSATESIEKAMKTGDIEFAMAIEHQKEKNETKNHTHLYMEPNKRVNPQALKDKLNLEKKTVMPLKISKPTDWIMYCLHNRKYLKTKKLKRSYSYTIDQIIATDNDKLAEYYCTAMEEQPEELEETLLKYAKEGTNFEQIVLNGEITLAQIASAEKYYRNLMLGLYGTIKIEQTDYTIDRLKTENEAMKSLITEKQFNDLLQLFGEE